MQFITFLHCMTIKIAMRTYGSFSVASLEIGVQHVFCNLVVSTIGPFLFELECNGYLTGNEECLLTAKVIASCCVEGEAN